MACVRPFQVWLVDEPFVGLDKSGRDALLDLFHRVHADGAALVVGVTAWWVRRRDEWRIKIREFMDAGTTAGRSAS